jgi:hypothetical protein
MLRPEPHRGDVIAAGAVTLAALVALLQARFDHLWGNGTHLLYTAGALGLVGTLALRAPQEGPTPRVYQSALFVVSFVLAGLALIRVAELLGADGVGSGTTVAAIAGTLGAGALIVAVARNSAVCTLLGALALLVAGGGLVSALAGEGDPQPLRWTLLALGCALILGAVATRDRHEPHAVAFADAAGFAALALAASFLLAEDGRPGAGTGWELFLYACGFGLCAYSAVEREPGPGYLGVAVLAATTLVVAGDRATLLGWPLVLAVGAGALLVVGLRPSRPLPPAPDRGEPAHVFEIRDER